MAEGVLYLDVDDEITSAAARIRRAEGSRVVLVLPYGSKVATSRINFRLLARDALTHEKRLSIVAPDGATRALAASAGLPVFASVAEYETSLEEPGGGGARAVAGAAGLAAAAAAIGGSDPGAEPEPAGEAEDVEDAAEPLPSPTDATAVVAIPAAAAAASIPAQPVRPTAPSRTAQPASQPAISIPGVGSGRSVPRTPLVIGAGILALAVLVGAVGAYVLLPSASVVLTPHEQSVGPQTFSVVADTTASETDPEAGVVPADLISIDVSAEDTFESTGVRVERTRATGRVTFQSLDTSRTNTIPKGSIVSTEGGVQFRTLQSARLPRAQVVPPLSINPSSAAVDVEAVRNGTTGNVPANAITVVPPAEDPAITQVRNAQPTEGGSRTEFPEVSQEDVDNALAALREQLDQSFQEQLSDPSIAPPDTTIFDGTAVLGEATPTANLEELVGQELEEFELGLTSTGTVVAVDPSPVESIAQSRLESFVSPGFQLVDGSVRIEPGAPVIDGQTVQFPVTVEASEVQIPDAAELKRLIMGKTEDEARSVLAPFGEVDLTLWPDWVTSVPTFDARVNVEVRPPLPVEVVEPPGTPTAGPDTPSPQPSGGPTESPEP
jgi:Baseplate J-like protein